MAAELRVLGSVALIADGEPVPLGGARQRAIVAFLALRGGRPVPILQLVDEVWGAAAPRTVVKSLSTLASRLRRSIGPHGFDLRFDDIGYALHLPPDGLDLDRFRAEVGLARVGGLESDTTASIEHLRAALACWHGDPLDGLVAPFVDDAAADLEAERSEIEDELARLLLTTGAAEAAADLFESLVARDPFREDRWAALVHAYSAAGRRSDALDTFQRARRTLHDELGTEPGPILRHAEQDVLANVAPTPQAMRPIVPRPGRPSAPSEPAVAHGREAALALLEEEVRAAALGEVRVVAITGEPGVGKSHIVKVFAQSLNARGIPVAIGRCDPFGSVPLGPLLSLIEQSHAFGTLDPAILDDTPALQAMLSGQIADQPIGDAGDFRRNTLLRELRLMMRRFSVPRTVVVVIEDLHWMDPLTLNALRFMAGEATARPVLLVVIGRDPDLASSEAGRLIGDLERTQGVRRLKVGPLDREALRFVVAEALEAADDPEALLDRIERESGGNPLYARQLARHLASGADPTRLPDDVRHLMQARIRSIDESARELLVMASVLGGTFTLTEIGSIFPDSAEGIARRAEIARDAGLLEETDEPGRYRFVHGVIRQTSYELADSHQQSLLHFAAATIRGYGTRPASPHIARHLLQARPVVSDDDVARAVIEAAGPALAIGAHEIAGDLGRRALALDVGPELRAELHLVQGSALVSAGDHRGTAQLDAAHEHGRASGRWDLVADCLVARSRIARLFSTTEARQRADEIAEVLEADVTIGRFRRARLLAVQADALFIVDPPAALRAIDGLSELGAALNRQEIDHHVQHLRLRHRFATGAAPGKVAAEAAALVDRCQAAGDPIGAAHSAAVLQAARVLAGQLHECVEDEARLVALAEAGGRVDLAYQIKSVAVSSAIVMEPLGVGDQLSEALIGEAGAGVKLSMATRMLHLWILRREQGRLDDVSWLLTNVVGALDRVDGPAWLAACRMEEGRFDAALDLLEPVPAKLLAAPADWSRAPSMATVVDLAFDLGMPLDTRRFTAALRPLAGQVLAAAGWVAVLGRTDRYLGRLAQMRGDLDGAIEHFATARHLDQASGAHLWGSWAAHDEARARCERAGPGDAAVAEALLDGALRTAKRLGARRLAGSIRDALSHA